MFWYSCFFSFCSVVQNVLNRTPGRVESFWRDYTGATATEKLKFLLINLFLQNQNLVDEILLSFLASVLVFSNSHTGVRLLLVTTHCAIRRSLPIHLSLAEPVENFEEASLVESDEEDREVNSDDRPASASRSGVCVGGG
jgi:hypothetical protein